MSNSSERVWDNPALGTTTFYEYDAADDAIILRTEQDIEPIIEANKEALNNAAGGRYGDGKVVASIPIIVMQQLVQQGILSPRWAILDEPRFAAWLNSSENRYFRTFPGNV